MSIGRLIAVLAALVLVIWLVRSTGVIAPKGPPSADSATPVEKARKAAQATEDYNAQIQQAAKESQQAGSDGTVRENMTPDEVRSLLGLPDETETSTSEEGKPRDKWVYRSVGKTVIFENGVVVAVR